MCKHFESRAILTFFAMQNEKNEWRKLRSENSIFHFISPSLTPAQPVLILACLSFYPDHLYLYLRRIPIYTLPSDIIVRV